MSGWLYMARQSPFACWLPNPEGSSRPVGWTHEEKTGSIPISVIALSLVCALMLSPPSFGFAQPSGCSHPDPACYLPVALACRVPSIPVAAHHLVFASTCEEPTA